MENNVRQVRDSKELREGAEQLMERALGMARDLITTSPTAETVARGGRKAHHMS
jgi:hypothetical protein